ncbi:type II toxin-antitoxin system RelE/ParE family toxin [Candidatus Gracilibacteria bacterium]|nr:type II toxin-antitoxin system RelE/ParE family toxin [Candidatus Gracilibacteria bacterium]
MFYTAEITNIVKDDINELSDYIFRISFDKEIAKKIYNELYAAIFSLELLPNRYEKYLGEYRKMIVKGSYKIYYKVDEENKKAIIIRVTRAEQNTFKI